MNWNRNSQLQAVAAVMVVCIILMQGCIGPFKKMDPVDSARTTMTGVNKVYMDTYAMYTSLIFDSSIAPEQRAALFMQMAAPLDNLKDILMQVNQAQIEWDMSNKKPAAYDEWKAKFEAQNARCNSILAIAKAQATSGRIK